MGNAALRQNSRKRVMLLGGLDYTYSTGEALRLMYTGDQLREMFLNFFQDKGHTRVPCASLIPKDDPSLLLTVAGMVPFKPYFLGRVEPPYSRATTCQKCVRTPDLEEVGKTARHATSFEMLGNFSFGDYFKEEAITWAWEYVTEVLKISTHRLWVTVHPEDHETREFWKQAGVQGDRVVVDETNFWAAGPVGPCGPCSEIYVDLGAERGCQREECAVGCECDRFLEIWNLVFMQHFRDEKGDLTPLPKKNIDTGMGLDRIALVMQDVETIFDTDLFRPLIDKISEISGIAYEGEGTEAPELSRDQNRLAMKVVADHCRCVVSMLGDGIRPSSDGRGYVLRRILRRAVRYARLLGIEKPFLEDMYAVVLEHYGQCYPQLETNRVFILNHLRLEEKNFQATLEQGILLLQERVEGLKADGGTHFDGQEAFRIYETYGFPIELTAEILAEQGIDVDMAAYEEAMERHRSLAREALRQGQGGGAEDYAGEALLNRALELGPTPFVGYDSLSHKATIKALFLKNGEGYAGLTDHGHMRRAGDIRLTSFAGEGDVALCLLSETPFYAESGGQVSDRGIMVAGGADAVLLDLKKLDNGAVVHRIEVKQGVLKTGDSVDVLVDRSVRLAVTRHHSATHLLHGALRHVLGEHVQQAGSAVLPDRLRFDFAHFAAVSAEELQKVEDWANAQVLADHEVTAEEMSLAAAKERGAVALFGEKYGERVRMVAMGPSRELCGGTHVHRTGEIGLIKIVSEGGIGAGLRRVEALAGQESLVYLRELEVQVREMAEVLKTSPADVVKRAEQAMAQLRDQERKLQHLAGALSKHQMDKLVEKVRDVEGVPVLAAKVQAGDMDALRRNADFVRDRLKEGVVVLGAVVEDKVNLVAVVKPLGLKSLHAGKIIKEVAVITGGSGGGKADIAQAGGKDPARLGEALDRVEDIVRRFLQG